jgi:hypothetical protein
MNIIFDDAAEIYKSKIHTASPEEVLKNLFHSFFIFLVFIFK